MCGIYHIGRELENGLETMIRMISAERRVGKINSIKIPKIRERDVRPTELAPVLSLSEDGAALREVYWGIPGFQKGQLMINARSETAMEKQLFRMGLTRSRIVIPAKWFYEWNARKEKNMFKNIQGKMLLLAGFSVGTGDAERFTILTTAANDSMKPVHDRMPLVLEEDEVETWLFDEKRTEEILHKIPEPLLRETDYEQLSIF